MNRHNHRFLAVILSTLVASTYSGINLASEPANWSNIPVETVKLFYPGQSSYQWLRSEAHRGGYKQVIEGASCISCHRTEENYIGNLIASGKKLEPVPIPGKQGVIDLLVQATHDDDYLYLRFQWKSQYNREGRMHDMIRYDGKNWKFYGSHRANAKAMKEGDPPLYEDRVAIMIDDGTVPGFAEQGCWLTCHDGQRDMPDKPTREQVMAHPLLGKTLNKNDVRKYLPQSRTDTLASWDKTKTAEEIASLQSSGMFVDLMQWRAARSNPVSMADDGYVLEYRLFDKGKNIFSWNIDRNTMIPKYMFDAEKTGYTVLREEDFTNPDKAVAIIKEANARVYDPNTGFKEGDILPGRLLTQNPEGSAADNDLVKGSWKNNLYTVVFRRKLDTGHPEDDKVMKPGGVYNIGLSVHDDNVTTRFHHISFPLTLGIGVKAGITAEKMK